MSPKKEAVPFVDTWNVSKEDRSVANALQGRSN